MGHLFKFVVVVTTTTLMLGLLVASPVSAEPPGFVSTDGTQLSIDGDPVRFVGYNVYRATSLPTGYSCGGAMSDAELSSLFAHVRQTSGASVIRTWFFQSYYSPSAANPFAAFDRVVDAASAEGLKVIGVLANADDTCEIPNGGFKPRSFYQSGYQTAGYGYSLSYKDWAELLTERYKDNAAIAYWQLVNEPAPADCTLSSASATAGELRSFSDDMVGAVKAVDPNHLVSLGALGGSQCGLSGEFYAQIHGGAVDLCTFHDYHEPTRSMPLSSPDPTNTHDSLERRLDQCRALGKPLVIDESGITADVGTNGSMTGTITAATLANRAEFFNAKLDASFAAGVSGYLVWQADLAGSDSAANGGPTPYSVGSPLSTGGVDPTETALAAYTIPPAPDSCVAGGSSTGFGFEAGVAGWSGSSATTTTSRCSVGAASLQLTAAAQTDPFGASVSTDLTGLEIGSTLQADVWVPHGFAGSGELWASSSSTDKASHSVELTPGWNALQLFVSTSANPNSIGVSIDPATSWTGTIGVDDVSWTGPSTSVARDWELASGGDVASLADGTGVTFAGAPTDAATLTAAGYPAFKIDQGLFGLENGTPVTVAVHAPADISGVSIIGFATDSGWGYHESGGLLPLAEGWNELTFSWPFDGAGLGGGIKVINPTGWTGVLSLGPMSWDTDPEPPANHSGNWGLGWGGESLVITPGAGVIDNGVATTDAHLNGIVGWPTAIIPGAELTSLSPESELIYRVFLPAGSPTISVQPFAFDEAWTYHQAASPSVLSSGWNEISYEFPGTSGVSPGAGLKFLNPSGVEVHLSLGDLRWD